MSAVMRVVVVNEQPLFVGGLELLLPRMSNGRAVVVGSTGDATMAASAVRSSVPHLALVDLHLPAPGGVAAVAAIRRVMPDVRIVAMCRDDEPDGALNALHAGADGLLPETADPSALLTPLLAVMDGWTVLPARVLETLIGPRSGARAATTVLTDDERRLLRLISIGRTTAEMAVRLNVSERTVKRLVAALLRRLRVANRAEAATLAGRDGLL
jgi:DNA-binding NarL/FixJ family response regulator